MSFIQLPDDIRYSLKLKGVSEDVVKRISLENDEPEWMLQKRLESLEVFNKKPMPSWGPNLSAINFDEIVSFASPEALDEYATDWQDVPEELKNKFESLGIPEDERKFLAGAGGHFDSEAIYHKIKHKWEQKGVIFDDMSAAVHKYGDFLKEYFMKLVPPEDHKFAALHGALWSGGSFIYVPKGVKLDDPLQSYFRMNTVNGGQFEHTIVVIEDEAEAHYIEGCSAPSYSTLSLHAGMVEIFVGNNAKMGYSSVENWSKNTYNLNTKRAVVGDYSSMEWVGGNFGSGKTMLYPMTILKGRNSYTSHLGVAFAGEGQEQDVGAKVVHVGENTHAEINSKSISKDGGNNIYRGLIKINKSADNSYCRSNCDAMIIDDISYSKAYPLVENNNVFSAVAHEATAGKIDEEKLFYLTSRGIPYAKAASLIINGFLSPVINKLPLEYAGELNRFIELEIQGE